MRGLDPRFPFGPCYVPAAHGRGVQSRCPWASAGERGLLDASRQRGNLRKRGKAWASRWYDENGARRERGGFATKTEAGEWLDTKLETVTALRHGDIAVVRRQTMPTLQELVDEYVEQHNAEANTIRNLKARLEYATDGPALDGTGGFASVRIDRLTVPELGAWRKRLPERSAYAITKGLRQVLGYAVRVKLLDENVAKLVPNPEPKRREVQSFGAMEDVEAVGAELGPLLRAPWRRGAHRAQAGGVDRARAAGR